VEATGAHAFVVEVERVQLSCCYVGPVGSTSRLVRADRAAFDLRWVLQRFVELFRGGRSRTRAVRVRRAVTGDDTLFRWHQQIVGGQDDRREVTVTLLGGPDVGPLVRWHLTGAWPRRWAGPELDGRRDAVAIEEVELVYDRLEQVRLGPSPRRAPAPEPRSRP
jgi:hypothetical protein